MRLNTASAAAIYIIFHNAYNIIVACTRDLLGTVFCYLIFFFYSIYPPPKSCRRRPAWRAIKFPWREYDNNICCSSCKFNSCIIIPIGDCPDIDMPTHAWHAWPTETVVRYTLCVLVCVCVCVCVHAWRRFRDNLKSRSKTPV